MQIIKDYELLQLTKRDRQAFANALLNPPTPSDRAYADAQWYEQMMNKQSLLLVLNPKSVDFYIEPLEKHYDRTTFSCGNEQLNRYFHFAVTQDQKRNIAIPYVIFDRERQKIIGYYTLSTTGINLEQLPQSIVKKIAQVFDS